MVHLHCGHERPHARLVVSCAAYLSGLVENCVEFAYFVRVTDLFKKVFDRLSRPRLLEIPLRNTQFNKRRWEQQVYGLWLVSIVLVVANRPKSFSWDIRSNRWATE